MEEMLIGPYIRQKRLDKGWTQEELCDGICSVPTLSRIETCDRTPSSGVLKALLEKLGLPTGPFVALLGKDDLAIEKLKKDIRCDKLRLRRAAEPDKAGLREQILTKLKDLEELGAIQNFDSAEDIKIYQGTENFQKCAVHRCCRRYHIQMQA